MTISVGSALWLLFAHFLGDFPAQTDEMAKGKSESFGWLSLHVLAYSVVAGLFTTPLFPSVNSWVAFWGLNAALHFATDAVTSRITKYYWVREQRHNFFVAIGADQFIHAYCLILTYAWIGGVL